jgi:hypothetical protein
MSTSNHILFDDALWPLLVLRYVGLPTTAQVERSLEELTRHLERGQRFVLIMDSTRVTGMGPAEQRHLQADWLKRHDARLRELALGGAFVITSPLVRLGMSVVVHLKPLPAPYVVTASFADAARWAAERLRDAGEEAAARRVLEHHCPLPEERLG